MRGRDRPFVQSRGAGKPTNATFCFLRQCQLGQVQRVASPGFHPVSLSVP
jgi:hypothetical protein